MIKTTNPIHAAIDFALDQFNDEAHDRGTDIELPDDTHHALHSLHDSLRDALHTNCHIDDTNDAIETRAYALTEDAPLPACCDSIRAAIDKLYNALPWD